MPEGESYHQRNRLLRDLGFADYAEYLASETWRFIKARRLKGTCRLCEKAAAVLHHTTYSRDALLGKDDSVIIPLCHGCHFKIEFDGKGRKRGMSPAQRTFQRLLRISLRRQKKFTPDVRRNFYGYCRICGERSEKKTKLCRPCRKRAANKT